MWGRGQAASGWNPEGNIPQQLGQQLPGMNAAPTWSLDPNHYRQIPHNQVDWASLAQQWIQMKGTNVNQNQQVEGQSQEVAQAPPVPQHHQHQTQAASFQHQHQHHQDVIGEAPMDLDESVNAPLYTRSSAVAAGGIGTSLSPNVSHFSQHQPNQTWSQPAFHQNQINEHLGRSSASEVSGGNTYGNNSWMHSGVDFSNYNVNDRRYTANYTDRRQSYQEEETYEEDLAEAARRRALPSWIREGLEKVEREKRKAEEKERLAEQREEERRLRRKRDQEQTETSKWASDFDQPQVQPEAQATEEPEPAVFFGADGDKEGFSIKLKGSFRQSQPRQLSLDEILASLTKDEQMEQVMLSVRRQLTKILLEVTNEEMRTVAVEALERAKAKQKVTSSRGQSLVALTSLTGGPLGLGDYGSDSEDQDDSSNSDDAAPLEANEVDSEDDLIAEIERKKRNFEMKLLADEEEENIKSRGKSSAEVISRSRSKSGDSFPGTNGKSLHSAHSVSTTKAIAFQPEKSRVEEEKVVKKAERRRASRSRSHEKTRRDSECSRRLSTSSRKEDKHDRSRSRERRRRSRSHSRGRDVTHRSRSTSPSHRDKARRRSRSVSKSRKDRRSRSSSKTKKDKRRRSRSSSKTKSKTKHSRSPSLSKSKTKKSRSRSLSKSKSKSKRRSRSSSTSRNSHRRSRSSSKSKHGRRRSRSSSKSRKGKKRRHQSRSTSPARSRDKQHRTSDISKRRRRSASSSSSRSSSPSNSGKPTH